MSTFSHNNTSWQFQRYPKTENRSLRAWSAADELLLHNFDEFMSARETEAEKFDTGPEVGIYHDRFGFLATVLQSRKPSVLYIYSSQDKSMRQNLQLNELEIDASRWVTPQKNRWFSVAL